MSAPKKAINLLRGWPSPSLLPAGLLSQAAQRILADPTVYTPVLQYGPDCGYGPLREGLACWLGRHYRVDPDPERISITGGASQNIACVLQTFTDPVLTRAVWIVAPCYYLGCAIFDDAGFQGRLKATPEDEEGIDLDALENKIRALEEQEKDLPKSEPFKDGRLGRKIYKHIIYVVPTCSNPSGKTMSLRRREGLVRLARKYDALVISDDVYDFLQWPTAPGAKLPPASDAPPEMRLPRLCDIDRAMDGADLKGFGNTISNGSFSKIAGPGVRTGWAEAFPALIEGLSMTGSTRSGGCPSQLSAAIISSLVNSGELESYIDSTTRPALQKRHGIMVDAIRQHVSPHGVRVRETSLLGSDIYGGYFIWFTLEDGLSAKLVADVAMEEENLIVGSGDIFEVHGDEDGARFDSEIRLCFSWVDEEDLIEGTKRLGEVLGRIRDNRQQYESRGPRQTDPDFVNSLK
ncbi:Aspartate/methionine/tyrosine aminotransferase [Geosmithia morbida]|uniref:Aspartate/methionine/tyrosine aminotransferase n=1 Tax=Geosmithia morbida TaxID=1094350 RepID=A0A9P5D690_9HYPO|nr:Aspartate/methionine/tyrosine aminotransferase [Geosmithia morbida]KAF4125371.1 Aspartate/methionine/tyrosine aminotransferase [Geosmithia morbida]